MSFRLSRESIESFCGNVIPLSLISEEDLSARPIRWRCEGDAVVLRAFCDEKEFPFSDGVLATLIKPGQAAVYAELEGKTACCRISVRPMITAAPGDPIQYFIGDFHDHTTSEHNHERFALRQSGFPIDVIRQIHEENKLDFHVISDHASTLNPRDFFRGFTDEQAAQPMELIVFPGSESEVTAVETDRYGVAHKNSGEIVTVNAAAFSSVLSWESFYQAMEASPFAVCALAHPQIVGWSVPGIWNFSLHKNNTPQLMRMVKMIEMGNGADRESNQLHEYTYSVALDNGMRVSTTCSSDCHGPVWGHDVFPGKTIIMATEKSKEAFLDAMLHNRIYACESGNLKLRLTVNGMDAPADLPAAEQYDFRLAIDCFHDDPSTLPVCCQLISDYGKTLLTIRKEPFSSLDFTVRSESARYFYLRLTDSQGRKTWSPPVYTGRAYDAPPPEGLIPIDKTGFTAVNERSGADASILFSDDPKKTLTFPEGGASVLIDMQRIFTVCAVGHYPFPITREVLKGVSIPDKLSEFPSEYRISVSADGERYTDCACGIFRVFGGEEIIRFPACKARYVRIEIITTVGRASGLTAHENAPLTIGELTVFTRQ